MGHSCNKEAIKGHSGVAGVTAVKEVCTGIYFIRDGCNGKQHSWLPTKKGVRLTMSLRGCMRGMQMVEVLQSR